MAIFPLLNTRLPGIFCLLAVTWGHCQAPLRPPRVDVTDRDTVGYSFVNQDKNEIENANVLRPFFQKLHEQRINGGRRISIVHIGDSHILGNFLTREVRTRLQMAFGDAGRGLIFPYKIAGTNGPQDYLIETNCRWQGSNCQRDRAETTPHGLTGFNLETTAPDGQLGIRLRDTATSDTRLFTKLTVFHRNEPTAFDLDIRDEANGQTAHLVIENELASTYFFDRPTDQAVIRNRRTEPTQKSICLDGICLENELSGVLYHTIGVNGGRFADFSRAKYFTRQVGELFPDLIILSFGTNEAQDPKLSPEAFYQQIGRLVSQLSLDAPGAKIMLTTPADSYWRGKSFNPKMAEVSATIRKYALDNGLALWDLYNIGGGEQSAKNWKSNGLMSADSVHYSKLGYAMQGKLLYLSLVKSYNASMSE